ncbi:MAG: NusG domain II-containing protein [Firmicutes bacterium]|nr:NusG domain II-containing protein [Bacillota bacterium]
MTKSEKIESIKKGKPFRLTDIFFLAGLAAAVLALCWWVYWSPPAYPVQGVEVRQNGKLVERPYAFPKPDEEPLEIPLQGLTLVIESGACYVKKGSSTCPDHACERMGKITRPNQKIVCIPNGIVIRLVGESNFISIG